MIVSGVEVVGPPEIPPKQKPRRIRISKLDARTIAWILSRVADFETSLKPTYSYPTISKNLARALSVIVSPRELRKVVARHDPELYAERCDAYRRAAARVKAKKEARLHWLERAGRRVKAGESEDAVLASFGWVRIMKN